MLVLIVLSLLWLIIRVILTLLWVWSKTNFSWLNICSKSANFWSLISSYLFHSLTMIFIKLLNLLFLIVCFLLKSLMIPFKAFLVSNYERFKTKNIYVSFVFECLNNCFRNGSFNKNINNSRREILFFTIFFSFGYWMLINFFSKFSHSFFAIWYMF